MRSAGSLDRQRSSAKTFPDSAGVRVQYSGSDPNKPPGWKRWSAAEKVEHFSAQTKVIRVVAMVAAKVGGEMR
jgi:hypothetical protein